MQGFAQGYSIGGKLLYNEYTNSTFKFSESTEALDDLNADELFFLALSILFLYCYLRLLRWKVPSIIRFSPSPDGIVGALSSLRKWPKRSGLTPADIENRLKSFSVEAEGSREVFCGPSADDGPEYCKISFGQESCAICLEGYSGEDSRVRQLPCDHIFHQGALVPLKSIVLGMRVSKTPFFLLTVILAYRLH